MTFVIYPNPLGEPNLAWKNYATRMGLVTATGERWFVEDRRHAAAAEQFGMLVATVEVVGFDPDEVRRRFCEDCGADIDGNDPHEPGCPRAARDTAILNIQTATKRIAGVWEGSQNDELAEAQAELEQAVRFLTGEEVPS